MFLAKAIKHRPSEPLTKPLYLALVFYFKRPKSHYRTGRYKHLLKDKAPEYHTTKPDIDNLVKFVADSLNKVFYEDDSQVVELLAKKVYCDDNESARTDIVLDEY